MQLLDLVAVAVLAVGLVAWLAYNFCSRVLDTWVFLLGEGALALLELHMSMIQKIKALKRCQAVVASVKDCITACCHQGSTWISLVSDVFHKSLELSCQEEPEGAASTYHTGCWDLPACTAAVNP